MPTYEYRCEACSHEFEHFQSIKSPCLEVCPACGKKKLKRLIGTGGGIIFKGSGFYETDYRSDSYKRAAAAEKSGSTSGSTSKSTSEKSGSSEKAKSESGTKKTTAA
ncbi:MAG: zinc ribbon domain-containing protein [Phycisphaerae bacterium]|nr:zinc ribbon domain-containing protein [Phycisphaerae bacterium]